MTTQVDQVVEDRVYEVAGLEVHVSERGNGEPLVVLHHSTGPLWVPFHDHLGGHFDVHAPDIPGYGRSQRLDSARSPRDLAILLHQLLDTMAIDRTHLIGLGFGGYIAAEMATMGQHRLATLTLVGAAGVRPREGAIHDPMTEGWIDYARLSFRDEAAFEEFFGAAPAKEIIDVWDFSREMTARVTWKPWMFNLSLVDLLRGVTVPTLLVWGAHDRIVPLDSAHQYAEALPNSRLEVVADAGHVVELEQPELLVKLIAEFVSSSSRGE